MSCSSLTSLFLYCFRFLLKHVLWQLTFHNCNNNNINNSKRFTNGIYHLLWTYYPNNRNNIHHNNIQQQICTIITQMYLPRLEQPQQLQPQPEWSHISNSNSNSCSNMSLQLPQMAFLRMARFVYTTPPWGVLSLEIIAC